ncbi:MAG: ATP-binding protein [Spirochaetaceae bacterium]|nr:ATP-binding protein [Spirochaetaceae bacterium]
MSKKIFRAIFFVSTFFLLISFFVISGILYSEFLENEKSYLRTEIKFLKELLSTQDDFLENFKSDTYRLTLISEDGEVIFDSKANVNEMNNHINRKEIEKAIEIGSGESLRYSDTLLEKTIYIATLLPNQNILRISTNINTIWAMIFELVPTFFLIFVILTICCGFLSNYLAKQIIAPLNKLNLDNPMENQIYDEVSPLLYRIHKQNKKIKEQMKDLQQKIDEKIEMQKVKEEFSANVSHELKTPLQSIIGYTELFENNLVKPEDSGKFIGNIKKESMRLVALINDIIHLSELDEIEKVSFEKVDLAEVISETISLLTSSASKRNVTLYFENKTASGIVQGVPSYIQEIVYNLIDNAIRYNKEGGKVFVSLEKLKNGKLEFSVKDTGIGIPEEYQQRVFERFFRVDKSHSRETGGTGLGLSIVKHAAKIQNAKLTLESQEKHGTRVSVVF